MSEADAVPGAVDVAIIGGGISGMYMLHRLRGLGLSTRVIEAGSDVGGTWYWNRYPGARVDIESQEYSYSFSEELEREWQWSERYAAQPEILAYLGHVADRFDLRRDISFDTRVEAAHYDEAANRWRLTTDKGETIVARLCVAATGCLSVPNEPVFAGQEDFAGPTFHTGRWPHEGVDFTGQHVAVIGTGSSAIQSIPQIAKQAASVTVFQRTPNYSVPAHNGPIDPEVKRRWLADRDANRQAQRESPAGFIFSNPTEEKAAAFGDNEQRRRIDEQWARGGFAVQSSFADVNTDPGVNAMLADYVADRIREQVNDPVVAERLVPKDYPFGSKRLCVDTGYYPTFNLPHVTLVDLKEEPLDRITTNGVKTSARSVDADAIVFAIGFDAMTGALERIDIRGVGGVRLVDEWAAGPVNYLGLMVAGFPNFFTITGPGSPSVLSNMIVSIEQHVDWLADLFAFMRDNGVDRIEPGEKAQAAWVEHVNDTANMTLYPVANSWYLGANVPGKPRVFMPYIGGVGAYRQYCDAVAANAYMGFKLGVAG